MSIECGICERNLRGEHAPWCPKPEMNRMAQRIRELEAELSERRKWGDKWCDRCALYYHSESCPECQREAAEAALDKAQRALYALKVGEEPPEHDPITDSWWALIDKLKAAEADRDSWRRVAERCESEKQAAEAKYARLREALEQAGYHLKFATPRTRNGPCIKAVGIIRTALEENPKSEPVVEEHEADCSSRLPMYGGSCDCNRGRKP